jgi:D-amino-acid oxidase
MRATVVGAGVSGLTTALVLRRAGWDAHVVAAAPPLETVSAVAAAVWTMADLDPVERTRPWAIRSRQVFEELAGDRATGVVRLLQLELERTEPGPLWWETTPWVRRLSPERTPAGCAAAFEVDGFMVEPPIYLPWLLGRLEQEGGTVTIGEVGDLGGLDGLVVNCSGLGSRRLCGDREMTPIRGQVVLVPNPGIDEGTSDESDPHRITYVYPRSTQVVLGGTRQPGAESLLPDPATTERILADAAALDHRVAGAPVQGVKVGLRPGRTSVRVEREVVAGGRRMIHNYGHGGCGYTLSWGCAEEVARLAAG